MAGLLIAALAHLAAGPVSHADTPPPAVSSERPASSFHDECIITSADLVVSGPQLPPGVREYRLGSFGAFRATERAATGFAWEGSLEDGVGQALQADTSVGTVVVCHLADGSTIQAMPLGDGTTRVIRSAGALPGCAGALTPPAKPAPPGAGANGGQAPEGGVAGGCDDGSVIDVLVMWTPTAQTQSGGATAARAIAESSVAISNHVYATSLINVRMRAVGYSVTEAYSRDATSNVIYDLTGTSDGFLDSVHALRDSVGADLVSLITGENLNYCGIAWIAGDNSPSYGFSVTVWNCALGNLTFTHEVGHNQGCCHAPGDGGGCNEGGIFSYSVGHRFNGTSGTQWRTVMAYAPGNRVPRFSSPLVTHDGAATGLAGSSGADNSRTLNETAAVMANYRCSVFPQTGARVWFDSGLVAPPTGGASQSFSVADVYAAAAGTDVEISLAARADHDAENESFALVINSTSFGTLLGGTGTSQNCAIAARTTVVSAAAFNAAILGAAPVTFKITSSAAVEPCPLPGEMRLSIRYVAATSSTSCDATVLFYADQDGDGYTLSGGAYFCPGTTNPGYRPVRSALVDCNDTSAAIYPGAPELCATAGTDNDCDGNSAEIDANASDRVTFYRDQDGDLYTLATGAMFCPGTSNSGYRATLSNPLDCNDTSAAVYPGAPELCATAGTDNDCDSNSAEIDANAADRVTFYRDQDGDLYTLATGVLFCPGTSNSGYRATLSNPLDCNDASATIYPGAPELCATAGTDNDCDSNSAEIDANATDRISFFSDADGDLYTLATGALFCPGTSNSGYRATLSSPLDCNDTSATVYPGAPELCATAGTDNDCDGNSAEIDANATDRISFFSDADGDLYTLATGALFCPGTSNAGYRGTISSPLDCNDTSAAIYPGAPELCATAGIDNDCDSNSAEIDANAADRQTFYRDQDGDLYTLATTAAFCPGAAGPGWSAQLSSPLDCDDQSAATYPGAPESCSTIGTDNDCDGDSQEAIGALIYYLDGDGDGFGSTPTPSPSCDAPQGFVTQPGDCDDSAASVYPDAPELCANAGNDNDCDGNLAEIDSNASDRVTFYRDQDGDLYTLATGALFCPGTANIGYRAQVSTPLDCNDASAAAYPGAPELCATEGTDNDCDGQVTDVDASAADRVAFFSDSDSDGYTLATGATFCPGTTNAGYRATMSSPLDCNDASAAVYPGAPELCATAGTDNDCDGQLADIDVSAADSVPYFADSDADGYTLATGATFCPGTTNAGYRANVSSPLDCNDTSAAVYPAAPELCATAGTDNDCDGQLEDIDAGAADRVLYFADSDGDGYTLATGAMFCPGTANAGYRATMSSPVDCNDASAAVYPGAPELCATAGTDNDCDGDSQDGTDASTFYLDADGDGFGDDSSTITACSAPPGYVTIGGDGCPFNPFALAPIRWYRDADGDFFGNPNQSILSCSQPPGHIPEQTDCDDTRASVNPAAQERCDDANLDEDCDGSADDQDPSATGQRSWHADADGDGFGAGPAVPACDAPSVSHVQTGGDCDDGSAATYPDAPELCATEGTDNDCDGDSAEATNRSTWYRDGDGDGYGDSYATQQACAPPPGFVAVAGDNCPSIANPLQTDCDIDGYGDACEIAGGAADCDADGVPDACEVASGGDADGDGTLDACQGGDCNLNGTPDSSDILQGISSDCNSSGVPDECEDGTVHADTGNLGALVSGAPLSAVIQNQTPARTPVTIRVSLRADLDGADEYAILRLNGIDVAQPLFAAGGSACPVAPDTVELTLTAIDWLQVLDAAAAPGSVQVHILGSAQVDSSGCPGAYARVTISYGGTGFDCDSDGYSDICQFDAATDDCNDNGIFDACEIGTAQDTDSDGIPDECERARGDYNIDGRIDGADLAALLTAWGLPNPPFGDIVVDGTVDGKDLAMLLAMWGPIP